MAGPPTGRTDPAKDWPARDWHRRAGDLAQTCAGSFAGEEQIRLTELADLLAGTPQSLRDTLGCPASLPQVETAAADGAIPAVLRLIETCRGGYLLSWGADGGHMASVVLPGAAEEATLGADSAALALMGALALALSERDPLRAPGPSLYRADGARLN